MEEIAFNHTKERADMKSICKVPNELERKAMCFSPLAVKCISAAKENDFPSRLPLCLADWLLGSVQAVVLQLCV